MRSHTSVDPDAFEQIVEAHYEALYRFALSLTHREAEACDLTQETFKRLAVAGGQIRDPGKVKAWLFTTLHRRFLTWWRWHVKFQHIEISVVDHELPATDAEPGSFLDETTVREALQKLNEIYRGPLVLFYLEEHSYVEIAAILGIPIGTVMSRISRGRALLKALLQEPENESSISEKLVVL